MNERKSEQAELPHTPQLLDNTTNNEWQGTHHIHIKKN